MQDTPPDLLLNPFSTLLCVLGQPLCSYIKGLPSPLASSWVWPMGRLHSRLKGGLRVTSGCLLPSFPSSGFDSHWCVLNVTVPFLRASPDNSYFGFQKKQCLFKTLFIFPNLSVSSMYCPGPLYKDPLSPIARMSHTASPRYQEGCLAAVIQLQLCYGRGATNSRGQSVVLATPQILLPPHKFTASAKPSCFHLPRQSWSLHMLVSTPSMLSFSVLVWSPTYSPRSSFTTGFSIQSLFTRQLDMIMPFSQYEGFHK